MRTRPVPIVLVGVAGAVSGAFGAYCYYDALLRPLAHTVGLWVLLAVVVAARRPARSAVLRTTVALLAAVLAFYVGLQVVYGIRYPGLPYALNVEQIGLWCLIAVVAGAGLGLAFHRVGDDGWPGAVASAAAVGILVADMLRRVLSYPDAAPVVVTLTVIAVGIVLVLTGHGRTALARAALLVVPGVAVGYVLVSAPDIVEQVMAGAGI